MEEYKTFLTTAPDNAAFTQMKVVAIIAINGLLRLNELVHFDWANISEGSVEDKSVAGTIEQKQIVQLQVCRSKRSGPRQMKKFIVSDPLSVGILLKYMNSFEDKSGRLFRKLKPDLSPSKMPIGQSSISSYPEKIAEFLKLAESDKFSSHSFRHTGASILADDGATVLQLQQAGGWESSSIAQAYVEEGTHSRLQIAQRFEHSSPSEKSSNVKSSTSVSSVRNENIQLPSISIGDGSSNNHIYIGYPTSSLPITLSTKEHESKEI
jgi:integrase